MTRQETACSICRRLALWREGRNAHFVHEFEHSVLVVGDHQFHKGYCLLLLKEHVRELHELEPAAYLALSQELMTAGRAVVETFGPWKMNYACYGNQDPHIHWHLFPRYDSEPDHLQHPWLHAAAFKDHLIDEATARELAAKIRTNLTTYSVVRLSATTTADSGRTRLDTALSTPESGSV